MMTRLVFALPLAISFSVIGFSLGANGADVKASEFVVCKSGKSVRTLSVTPEPKKAATGAATCKVSYSKGGVAETVGEHTNKALCHSILDQVKVSLEDSKWNCRNVSASVTTSSEATTQ